MTMKNINSLKKTNPEIIKVEPNSQNIIGFMASWIRKSIEEGYNSCTFKFEGCEYKDLLALVDMLKEANYQTILLYEDVKQYNTVNRVFYLNTVFPETKE